MPLGHAAVRGGITTGVMIYILCRDAEANAVFTSWMSRLQQPLTVVTDCDEYWVLPDDATLVLTQRHFSMPEIVILARLMRENTVPVLILADGLLEYRNTWLNAGIPCGSMYQPLLGHKMACIGRSQARMVESWGNPNKCEVVGFPRLSSWERPDPLQEPASSGTARVLICSATTPAFNDDQWKVVVEAYRALFDQTRNLVTAAGRTVEIVWRLTPKLLKRLPRYKRSPFSKPSLIPAPDTTTSLRSEIMNACAVITSPSTIQLEAMLMRRPVAIVDFSGSPSYTPGAWSISSRDQILPVIEELLDPPRPKLQFQEQALADHLEYEGDAIERMLMLIKVMAAKGQRCRESGEPPLFQDRILDLAAGPGCTDPSLFDRAALYPDAHYLGRYDLHTLEAELEVRRLAPGTWA